jgi:hypothetical protein
MISDTRAGDANFEKGVAKNLATENKKRLTSQGRQPFDFYRARPRTIA